MQEFGLFLKWNQDLVNEVSCSSLKVERRLVEAFNFRVSDVPVHLRPHRSRVFKRNGLRLHAIDYKVNQRYYRPMGGSSERSGPNELTGPGMRSGSNGLAAQTTG